MVPQGKKANREKKRSLVRAFYSPLLKALEQPLDVLDGCLIDNHTSFFSLSICYQAFDT